MSGTESYFSLAVAYMQLEQLSMMYDQEQVIGAITLVFYARSRRHQLSNDILTPHARLQAPFALVNCRSSPYKYLPQYTHPRIILEP